MMEASELGRTLGNMDGELDQGGPVEGRRLHQLREGGDEPTISTTLSGIPKRTRLHWRSKFKGGLANLSRRRRLRSHIMRNTPQRTHRRGREEQMHAFARVEAMSAHADGCEARIPA